MLGNSSRSEEYWEELRQVARQTEPELALAQHLANERRRLYRWYPYGESWRESTAYQQACEEFEHHVLSVLAEEGAKDGAD